MKKYIEWFVLSSKNPEEISLTVRALLTGASVYVLFFAGLFHLNIGQSDIASLIDQITTLVGQILMIISGVVTLWAFLRKIGTTILGTNQVINRDI